jgi:hypothetical protein
MSSNISLPGLGPLLVLPASELVPLPELDEEPELPVEYFVDVELVSSVCTSVPNSVQASQTSSSAPSIFTRFGELVSVPHISH